MKINRFGCALAVLAAAGGAPALADTVELASAPSAVRAPVVPEQLTAAQRETYRIAFAAIRSAKWDEAATALDTLPDGLLTPVARAELYLAKDSPKVELDRLVALVAAAPDLPQAPQLASLAKKRGAEALPEIPVQRDMVRLARAPIRARARSTAGDAAAATLGAEIVPLIKDDRPSDAEAVLAAAGDLIGTEARTEWQQRVAWSYFLTGDDASARRLADAARRESGAWAVQADWVAGLAAWRSRDYLAAADAFANVAARGRDGEMIAAGLFWAARADMAGGRPDRVQPRLRTAARLAETFYGLLAQAALGTPTPSPDQRLDLIAGDWDHLSSHQNARRAAALVEVGETALADAFVRHQARIGETADHEALLHLAARLNLPSAQIWLAQNGPAGVNVSASARYPAPGWVPQGGWRVDKSLVYAHALVESQFRTDALSPAGARGLMQVLPSTAQLIARHQGQTVDAASLYQPAVNIAYGQAYLEELRDAAGTGGLLPKVIAAYNAGPGAVMKWNDRARDRGDPLLFVESIPYVETRGYVVTVLRNYWMYQQEAGDKSASLHALAQYMWPKFPGLPGKAAIRLDAVRVAQAAE